MAPNETPLEHAVRVLAAHGVHTIVIGLDDLIAIKRSLGRPKDLDALQYLLVIKEILDP
jgi:hypothetical protein